jgi:hypothetical protein
MPDIDLGVGEGLATGNVDDLHDEA